MPVSFLILDHFIFASITDRHMLRWIYKNMIPASEDFPSYPPEVLF
jgi:hypothetical protein